MIGMNESTHNMKPWLVAAWPGMGNVAAIAAGYLIQKLGMQPESDLPPRGHFDVPHVEVHAGVVAAPRLPRNVFYKWKNPGPGRDLVVLLGEAQPSHGSYAFAHELLDQAQKFGVERVVTFASMASRIHPSQSPKVYGAATGETTVAELRGLGVEMLNDGQIGGLNGVLLGAGAERGVPGVCLLGEMPFFAAGVPNPKAARAVLSVFAVMAGVDINLDELDAHARTVDNALTELLARMREHKAEGGEVPPLPDDPESDVEPLNGESTESDAAEAQPGAADPAANQRIEELFEEVGRDRSKAGKLKEELDRLGLYGRYENRFLDLFKRAE
jgi:proteasome assembly chaperone (PAC2) family protein